MKRDEVVKQVIDILSPSPGTSLHAAEQQRRIQERYLQHALTQGSHFKTLTLTNTKCRLPECQELGYTLSKEGYCQTHEENLQRWIDARDSKLQKGTP